MQAPTPSFTPIADVGEFGLIDRLRDLLDAPDDEVVWRGIGDDAAVVRRGAGLAELITTDALVEGVHFDRTFVPMPHLGFKAIAVNVSDIIAMNGRPRYAVVALALAHNMSVEMVEALYAGMKEACAAYDVRLVGGDTTASRTTTIVVTVVGDALEEEVVYRSGAEPGDLLCVTGDLGAAYAGLKLLLDRKEAFDRQGDDFDPGLEPYAYAVQRQLAPRARADAQQALVAAGVRPKAMIDISDGLASEVHHLCRQSGCGARVEAAKLPVHRQTHRIAEERGEDAGAYALFGGEDYELLFALDPDDRDALTDLDATVVGRFTDADDGVDRRALGVALLPGGGRNPRRPGDAPRGARVRALSPVRPPVRRGRGARSGGRPRGRRAPARSSAGAGSAA